MKGDRSTGRTTGRTGQSTSEPAAKSWAPHRTAANRPRRGDPRLGPAAHSLFSILVAFSFVGLGPSDSFSAEMPVERSPRLPPPERPGEPKTSQRPADSATTQRQRLPFRAMPNESLRGLGRQLAVAIGVLATLIGLLRIVRPPGPKGIPRTLVQVYGRIPLAGKQHLHLVRFGPRLILLSDTAQGVHRVAEINDPAEVEWFVERLSGRRAGQKWSAELSDRLADRVAPPTQESPFE